MKLDEFKIFFVPFRILSMSFLLSANSTIRLDKSLNPSMTPNFIDSVLQIPHFRSYLHSLYRNSMVTDSASVKKHVNIRV